MQIGGLGFLCIAIACILVLKGSSKNLLLAVVFFAPFCSSSVISFSNFYLQPGHFFLFLFCIVAFIKNKFKIIVKKPNLLLLSFVIFAFISITLALIFRIDVLVHGIGNDNQLISSAVSIQNFTQYLYLFLGFILYWCIYNHCAENRENWNAVCKCFAYSGIVVLSIGCYQILANAYALPYDEIFRNNVKDMWQTKERVQATFGEASFLGQYCVYLIAFYFAYTWSKNIFLKYISMALVLFIGIMSRSSTFLVGAAVVFVVYLLWQRKTRNTIVKTLIVMIIAALFGWYLFQTNEAVQKLIYSFIDKIMLESYSGVERSTIFWYMLEIGLSYPLFGIGYGGGRSTDLYANIISNTGFIGTILFFGFISYEFFILAKHKTENGSFMCLLLLVGFLATSTSLPDLSYLPVWVIFGLVDAQRYHLSSSNNLLYNRNTQ